MLKFIIWLGIEFLACIRNETLKDAAEQSALKTRKRSPIARLEWILLSYLAQDSGMTLMALTTA
jgi:hypothetical protein